MAKSMSTATSEAVDVFTLPNGSSAGTFTSSKIVDHLTLSDDGTALLTDYGLVHPNGSIQTLPSNFLGGSLALSPDGTSYLTVDTSSASGTTTVYKNGSVLTAFSCRASAWLTNTSILADCYTTHPGSGSIYTYDHTATFGINGLQKQTVPSQVTGMVVSSDTWFDNTTDTLRSITTGNVVWQGPYAGAIKDARVTDHTIVHRLWNNRLVTDTF